MTLPAFLLLSDYGGDWDRYLDAIYAVYVQDFAMSQCTFRGSRVSCRRHPVSQGKAHGFWHVVSTGKTEAERLIDLRRCERIRWIKHVITNADTDTDIDLWKNNKNGEDNVLLWLQEDYLVILGERTNYYLLRTAYCTDKSHRKNALRSERDQFLGN